MQIWVGRWSAFSSAAAGMESWLRLLQCRYRLAWAASLTGERLGLRRLRQSQRLLLDVGGELRRRPRDVATDLPAALGATGAVRTATLVHGLQRTKKKYGMVTMCIGTGMGAAGLFESMA